MPECLVSVFSLDPDAMRYPTAGDWQHLVGIDGKPIGRTVIDVIDTPNRLHKVLVAVHELIEAELCRHRGISQEAVDAFDKAFEQKRAEILADNNLGPHFRSSIEEAEPGDDPAAPYYKEHQFATKIELMLAYELGVDWSEYEKALAEAMG